MVRPSRVLTGLVLLLILAACGGSTGGASPTSSAPDGSPPPASVQPGSPAASAGLAGSSPVALDPSVAYACFGLGEADCGRALEAAAALLPAGFPVGYVQVGPFGCQAGVDCATTLLVRPSGQVTFEPTTGDPVAVQVTLGAGGILRAEPGESFTVRVAPQSPPQPLVEPVAYTLGHCGVGSGIDVDGSWWDPVGFVDADHGDAINAAEGTFAPTGPRHARFTSKGGFTVDLLRRVGEKHLPLCQ